MYNAQKKNKHMVEYWDLLLYITVKITSKTTHLKSYLSSISKMYLKVFKLKVFITDVFAEVAF